MDPNHTRNVFKETKTPSAATATPSNSLFITGSSLQLLNKIQKILAEKAPEAIPLLEEFDVYIRKSVSREERQKENNPRLQARELNKKEPQASKLLKGELRIKPSTYWTFLPTSGRRGSFRILDHKMGKWRRELWLNSFTVRTAKWLEALPSRLSELTNSDQFKRAIKKINVLESLGIPDVV